MTAYSAITSRAILAVAAKFPVLSLAILLGLFHPNHSAVWGQDDTTGATPDTGTRSAAATPTTVASRESTATHTDDDKRYSGPQVDEPLPPEAYVFVVSSDDKPAERLDLGELSRTKPLAILFMHEKSRPAFQTARVLSSFAALRKDSGLEFFVVVLSDDRSASEQWGKQISRYFEPPTRLAVADGGIEGPGSLGLNRLVDMTVLVAKEGTVTANFALTQVTAAVDAPDILKAINEVSGGGEIPDVKELLPQPQQQRLNRARNP